MIVAKHREHEGRVNVGKSSSIEAKRVMAEKSINNGEEKSRFFDYSAVAKKRTRTLLEK